MHLLRILVYGLVVVFIALFFVPGIPSWVNAVVGGWLLITLMVAGGFALVDGFKKAKKQLDDFTD